MTTDSRSGGANPAIGWLVLALTLLALLVNIWGIQKNLPYIPENDEKKFAQAAVRIAASGSANPGWFGHPGSTIIYPAAAAYRLRHGAEAGNAFAAGSGEFYLIGRIVAILYATLSIPLIYLVGKNSFGVRAGLVAAWLCIFNPLILWHTQIMRSDSAAMFFTALSLWRILETYDRPTPRNHILAGLAIGLSISSRYLMGTLAFLLLGIDAVLFMRSKDARKQIAVAALAGMAAVGAAFALTTPYFFLDFRGALRSLRSETRSTSLGADGLTPAGNLLWYVTRALPSAITWPQYVLAIAGGGLVLIRRRPSQVLLLAFAAGFVAIISLAALHWERWLIPIVPLFTLLAAHALIVAAGRLFRSPRPQMAFLILGVLAITAWPAYHVVLQNYRDSHPSTQVLARAWMIDHLPAGSRIVQEWYAAALPGTDFDVTEKFSLAEYATPERYRAEGYDYVVASDAVYARYYAEADRYPERVRFYDALFACDCLVKEFKPSLTQGGWTIRIYRMGDAPP